VVQSVLKSLHAWCEFSLGCNKPFQHLSFRVRSDLNALVTSNGIGRIDMSCAREQWVWTGYWRNSEGSVWPDQARLRTHDVESAY